MLSIQQYIVFANKIKYSVDVGEITTEEKEALIKGDVQIIQAILFGVSPREALSLSDYSASIYNKLYINAYYSNTYPDVSYLLQEAQRVENILQYRLIVNNNISVDEAIRLCPDTTENSVSSCIALEILGYDHYYIFDLLRIIHDNEHEHSSFIAQASTFSLDQISILRVMMVGVQEEDIPNMNLSIRDKIDIVRMIHPDNEIMKRAVARIAEGSSEFNENESFYIYQDIINDICDSGEDWWDVVYHYGFITREQNIIPQDSDDLLQVIGGLNHDDNIDG